MVVISIDAVAPAHRESAIAQPTSGQETILLVEDEAAILKMTATMLRAQGYTVLAAPTPGEALHAAESHSGAIDLLVTDVVMPGMNGRDLARAVGGWHPRIRILFMSGYTAEIIARDGVLEDGVSFLQKPFSAVLIAHKVRELLDAPHKA